MRSEINRLKAVLAAERHQAGFLEIANSPEDYLSSLGYLAGPFTPVSLKTPSPARYGYRCTSVNLNALPKTAIVFNRKYAAGSQKVAMVAIPNKGFITINLKTNLVIIENTAGRLKTCDLAETQSFLARNGLGNKSIKGIDITDGGWGDDRALQVIVLLKKPEDAYSLIEKLKATPQSGRAANFKTAAWSVYQALVPGVGLILIRTDVRPSVPASVVFAQTNELRPFDDRTS